MNKKNKPTFNELMKTLPVDIIYLIRFMCYKPQRNYLLYDIRNFQRTRRLLTQIYYMRCIIRDGMNVPEDKNWLINDIYAFLNKKVALMHGYVDEFYDVFKRNKNLKTKKQILKFIENLEKGNVSTQINIFIGLMNIKERIKLNNYCIMIG